MHFDTASIHVFDHTALTKAVNSTTEITALTLQLAKVGHHGCTFTSLSVFLAVPEVVTASWELLRVFDKNDARGESQPSLATEESRAALRDAVSLAYLCL